MTHDQRSNSLSDALVRTWTGVPEVSAQWLAAHPEAARVVDVREPAEFADGHLPGSELVPLGTLEAEARSWPRHTPIVVVCRSGMRSAKAARLLERLGFEVVASLRGGVTDWGGQGNPLVRSDARVGTR
jgi:rhodanese-related sulfurtransferase